MYWFNNNNNKNQFLQETLNTFSSHQNLSLHQLSLFHHSVYPEFFFQNKLTTTTNPQQIQPCWQNFCSLHPQRMLLGSGGNYRNPGGLVSPRHRTEVTVGTSRAAAQGGWGVQNSQISCCSEQRLRDGVQTWWQGRAEDGVLRLTSWQYLTYSLPLVLPLLFLLSLSVSASVPSP